MGHWSLILGHKPKKIINVIKKQLNYDWMHGVLNKNSIELSEKISKVVPVAEKIRYASTGTEATMYAVRLARTITKRKTIAKIDGGWHGYTTDLLKTVNWPFRKSESSGLTDEKHIISLPYNNLEKSIKILKMKKNDNGKWNLDDLVKNPSKQIFDKKIKEIKKDATQFEKQKKTLNQSISSSKFLKMLHQIEKISEKSSHIGGYASLKYSEDTQSDEATALLTKISQFGSTIQNQILFFDLWWKKQVDEKNAKRLMKSAGELSDYLRYKRLMSKYSLTEPEERIINTLDVTGVSALVKLYDKITNAFTYTIKIGSKKKTMGREELTTYVRSKNTKTREIAYKELLGKYHQNKGVVGEIYQNIVLNWKNEGIDIRKFKSPISIQNVGNDIDDKTVESLLEVCKKNAPLFQK